MDTDSPTWSGKLLRIALAFIMAFALTPTLTGLSIASGSSEYQAYATTYSWNVGASTSTDVTAKYDDSTNAMTIEKNSSVSGNAAMANYSAYTGPSWYSSYHDDIQSVTINSGVTNVGAYAFSGTDQGKNGYTALTYVKGSDTLSTLGARAFNAATASTVYDFTACTLTSVGTGSFGQGGQNQYNTAGNIVYVADETSKTNVVNANTQNPFSKWHCVAITNGGTLPTNTTLSGGVLCTPVKSGYTFTGWYTNSACTTAYTGKWLNGSSSQGSSDVVYAGWSKDAKTTPSLSVSPASLTLTVGGSTGSATITTNSDGAKSVASSDTSIATASVSGNTVTVTPVAAGTATITVVTAESETYASASTTLSVTVQGLSVSPSSVTATVGGSTVTAAVVYTGSYSSSITATSNNTSIATVTYANNTVTVTPVAAGMTTVTVSDGNGLSATLTVTVNAASTSNADYTQLGGYEPYQGWQGAPWYGSGRACYSGWTLYNPLSLGVTGYDEGNSTMTVGTGDVKIVTDMNASNYSTSATASNPNYFKNIILDRLDARNGSLDFYLMVLAAGGGGSNMLAGNGGVIISTSPTPSDWSNSSNVVWTAGAGDITSAGAGYAWCTWSKLTASNLTLSEDQTYYFVIKQGTSAGWSVLYGDIVFEFKVATTDAKLQDGKTWDGDPARAMGAYEQGVNGGTKIGIASPDPFTMTTDLTKSAYWHNTINEGISLDSNSAINVKLHADGSGSNHQTLAGWQAKNFTVYQKSGANINTSTGAITGTTVAAVSPASDDIGTITITAVDTNTPLGYSGVNLSIPGLTAGNSYYLWVPSDVSVGLASLSKPMIYEFKVLPNQAAYAMLYDDGSLVFQRGNTAASGKTLTAEYTGFEAVGSSLAKNYATATGWRTNAGDIKSVTFSDSIWPSVTNSWFASCSNSNLTSMAPANLKTQYVYDMRSLFSGCTSLATLDISGFDTSNVVTMKDMFSGCTALKSLTLGSSFSFVGTDCALPEAPTSGNYTGKWTNGTNAYSVSQLMNLSSVSGTWTWDTSSSGGSSD